MEISKLLTLLSHKFNELNWSEEGHVDKKYSNSNCPSLLVPIANIF